MNRLLAITIAALTLGMAPGADAQIPTGGFSSDGVEFVKNIAAHADTAGGVLHDGHYYITTERDLTIYDVSDPENPVETGSFMFPELGQPVFTEEDPETNGRIMPVENGGMLMIIDVSDKADPKLLSTLDGVDQHTVSCVLDCTWIYGSEGVIVDLRDPANPRLSDRQWDEGVSSYHDVTEVRPGIVLTSSEPMVLLDARTDPEAPTVLASTEVPGYTHANLWPHQASDQFALVGGESTGPDCSEDASATFQTWDTTGWETAKTFRLVDQFAMGTGLPPQGANVEATYCVHWFGPHPTYANGGLVAIGWYEHGVRFLKIATDGQIEEIGWYLPIGGQSSDVDWISNDVAYVADYIRGLDILRYTGAVPQGRGRTVQPPSPSAPPPSTGAGEGANARPAGPSFNRLVTLPSARRCVRARSFRVKVRRTKDAVRTVTLSVNGRRVLRAKGRALRRPLRVKRLPRRKRFSLQVVVRTRSGHTTAGQRVYRGC